jgi:hypothetical protein
MVEEILTNIYYKFCGNRKEKEFNPKEKIYFHPSNLKNKKCSTCYDEIKNPKYVSKIWKSFHVFCNTNCYYDWLIQFN